jgi:hypothetical protein
MDNGLICPSTHVFAYSFNTVVLRHIAFLNYVNGCPKIILDCGLFEDVNLQIPSLYSHLTSILYIFSCGDI